MKAQKIRRSLWLVSLLLGAAVVGVGALAVLTKPAEARDVGARAKKVMDEYRIRQPRPVLEASVKEEDLKQQILRPEWKPLPYYPYAGPRIPEPKAPTVVETVKEEGPKDLAAIGRVSAPLLFTPPVAGETIAKDTVVFWEFSADKKKLAFVPGEWIRANKDAPKRFLLVDVVREAPGVSRFRLLYDVYEVPGDDSKVRRAELLYDGEPKVTDKDEEIMPGTRKKPVVATPAPGTGATTEGTPGTTAATTGTAPVAPVEPVVAPTSDPDDWKPTIRTVNSGRRDIEFDENTFTKWKGKKIEDVLDNVRTENYSKGGVQGVQIFPLDGNDMASKFDVRRGDVLVSINGQGVKSKDDAIRIARAIPPDTGRVTVVVDRDGRQITYNVDPRDPKTRRSAAGLVPGGR
jgi:hypothetical protein